MRRRRPRKIQPQIDISKLEKKKEREPTKKEIKERILWLEWYRMKIRVPNGVHAYRAIHQIDRIDEELRLLNRQLELLESFKNDKQASK